MPRLTHLAGLELGAGVHLNIVAPEQAAAELRDAVMRAPLGAARVSRAAVRVDGDEVAAIGPGLLVLLGVTHDDDAADGRPPGRQGRARCAIFADADGRMNERSGEREVLVVSQFTLYGDARKGNRPSFVAAARPEHAEPLYERFASASAPQRGVFGAHMEVELVNDGPVTLLLELPLS